MYLVSELPDFLLFVQTQETGWPKSKYVTSDTSVQFLLFSWGFIDVLEFLWSELNIVMRACSVNKCQLGVLKYLITRELFSDGALGLLWYYASKTNWWSGSGGEFTYHMVTTWCRVTLNIILLNNSLLLIFSGGRQSKCKCWIWDWDWDCLQGMNDAVLQMWSREMKIMQIK